MHTLSFSALAGALLLLAPAAPAQSGGQVLWTVDLDGFSVLSQPRVAPDGTIYVVKNELHAISPQGQVLWTAPAFQSYIDLGPDGTIYTSSVNTIFAYNPDGSTKWTFTESPAGQGVMQGPTVGPDGHIYVVTDLWGLGAFSLTTDGTLRWNVPGFAHNAGTGLGRVQFGPDNLYFAASMTPGCAPLTSGLASVTLDGELDWCLPISGVTRPWATLDGKAIMRNGQTLSAYAPSSSLVWTHAFDGSPPTLSSVVVGPDNNVYAFHANTRLVSLTADGAVRWNEPQPLNNFPRRPAVAPDLGAVVGGSVYGFGTNGRIIAADPADGSTLWSIPVTGPSAGVGAPAEFSPDGQVVYVPIDTLDHGVPDQLWAVKVHDGGSACGGQSFCAGAPNSAGPGATMSYAGSTSVSSNGLVLHCSGVVPGQFGLFYYGSSPMQAPFGDGLRCVGGQTYRLPTQQVDASGHASHALDLAAPSAGAPRMTAGSTSHFQFWYRDPAAGLAGFNLSDGLSLTFCD